MNGRQILDIADQASKVEAPEIAITGIRYKLVACIIGEQYGGNFDVEDQQMETDLGTFKFNKDGYINTDEAALTHRAFFDLITQDNPQNPILSNNVAHGRRDLIPRLLLRYEEIMAANDEPISIEVPVRVTRQWDVTLIGQIKPSELAHVLEQPDERAAKAQLTHYLTQHGYEPLNDQADDLIKEEFDEYDKVEAGLTLMLPSVENLSGEFKGDTMKLAETIEALKIKMAQRNKNK